MKQNIAGALSPCVKGVIQSVSDVRYCRCSDVLPRGTGYMREKLGIPADGLEAQNKHFYVDYGPSALDLETHFSAPSARLRLTDLDCRHYPRRIAGAPRS